MNKGCMSDNELPSPSNNQVLPRWNTQDHHAQQSAAPNTSMNEKPFWTKRHRPFYGALPTKLNGNKKQKNNDV
ncbi:MAG: hypothetical protein L6R36_000383 [Xanthoria steineri]|nr:MAG: hypothetical protein L6R36_000383 [Xanthoria steineri]